MFSLVQPRRLPPRAIAPAVRPAAAGAAAAVGPGADRRTPIDEVEEPLRSQLEAAYLAACREVGELLLEAGRLREAWMYLRPAGDKLAVRRQLARLTADDGAG